MSIKSNANLFLEYSTNRREFQSIDILVMEYVEGLLDKASATTLFFHVGTGADPGFKSNSTPTNPNY
jgi:hypothetical protein